MNILHVVPSYIPAWRYGGPIRSVHGLCKALAARGHSVEVATTNVDGERDSEVLLNQPVDIDGVKVNYFASRRLRRLFYAPEMSLYLTAGIDRWDLIHIHSVFLWPTSAAAHVARKFHRPYVLSPRGMLVRDLIAGHNPLVKRAWIACFERRNIENASSIHVTSPKEAEQLQAAGFHPKRIFEIPNGFDPPPVEPPLEPSKRLTEPPPEYALFLGRISWEKGLDRLVAALVHAPRLNLVVAGADDRKYWSEIVKLAAKAGVAHRLYYLGHVDGADKAALVSGALMLVLPSYSENFGNVVLEAMALGRPVVVTPEVGASSLVAESGCGIVVDGVPAELGAAMARLAENAELRRQFGVQGRRAAQDHSWSAIAARFESQYQSLLTDH